MNANDVIEAYVADVVLHLPRGQRNDVAFELRALLHEELQARAVPGRQTVDAAQAADFLRHFGRPVDVAARYAPTVHVIDPVDSRRFVRWSLIGLAIIWVGGLLELASRPITSGAELLGALGRWWLGVAIPSLWWPGLLVACFAAAAWSRRRSPAVSNWTPRDPDRIQGGRAAVALGIAGIVAGFTILFEPRWILDVVWSGRAAPAAYQALTYTDSFWQRQAPVLGVLIFLNIPLLAAVIVNGRWTRFLRRLETMLGIATCAAILWTVLDGPVFVATVSDRMTKSILTLIVAVTLGQMLWSWLRKVRPAPDGARA